MSEKVPVDGFKWVGDILIIIKIHKTYKQL